MITEDSRVVNPEIIDILGGSQILAGINEAIGTAESKAGDIILNATEQVQVEQVSQIKNDVFSNATGSSRGGNLTITTKDLFVRDGAKVGTNTLSNYSTGDVRSITNENTSLHWKKSDPIIEPQGVYRLSDGKLVMSRECR